MTSVDWPSFQNAVDILIDRLRACPPFIGILAIERGGLYPAAAIAYALRIRYIHSVAVDTVKREVHKPRIFITNYSRWLVVDEICDSGKTLELVKLAYPSTLIAAVYTRPQSKHLLDFYGIELADPNWQSYFWE